MQWFPPVGILYGLRLGIAVRGLGWSVHHIRAVRSAFLGVLRLLLFLLVDFAGAVGLLALSVSYCNRATAGSGVAGLSFCNRYRGFNVRF
jgi:hypothetical protein